MEKMVPENQFWLVKKALEQKKSEVAKSLVAKHSQSWDWLQKTLALGKIKDEHLNKIAAAAATGFLLLSPGSVAGKALPGPTPVILDTKDDPTVADYLTNFDKSSTFAASFKEKVGSNITTDKEKEIEQLVTENFDLKTNFSLDGYRMNVNLGLIGAEQHLYRYSGDVLENHLETADDRRMYGPSGIAPGRGAWGYFGSSQDPDIKNKERYYFAVQTFLAPNWQRSPKATYEWFKFRKMVAINTRTGQAVVGVVGDAGPSQWTGKSFGGSPEVMHYLGLGGGPRKGEVLLLFVNDPDGKIPLGPIGLKELGKI